MRRISLILPVFLALGALAQIRAQSLQPEVIRAQTIRTQMLEGQKNDPVKIATPDAVVARLMSFDRNHDGLLASSELPERMQSVLARADKAKTGTAIDVEAIREMALHPAPQQFGGGGIQAGHYGFGDEGDLDTRLHLNGAIDDLRLAKASRDEVLIIANAFMQRRDEQETAELFAALTPLFTAAQLEAVRETLAHPAANVPRPAVLVSPNSSLFVANSTIKLVRQMQSPLSRLLAAMELAPDVRRPATAAAERFNARDPLSVEARTSLLDEMRGVLTDGERDDLRAALERRPLVKQGATLTKVVAFTNGVRIPATTTPPTPPPAPQFGVRDLVLR